VPVLAPKKEIETVARRPGILYAPFIHVEIGDGGSYERIKLRGKVA
jgi:hypothetical protein